MIFGIVIFLIFSVYFCFVNIFKIKEIEVCGNNRYTKEEIIEKINFKGEENLVLYDSKDTKEKIEKNLPYIDNIEICKNMPNKLVLKVKESKPIAVFGNDDRFFIIDSSLKILECIKEPNKEITTIIGLKVEKESIGSKLCFENKNQGTILHELMCALQKNEILHSTNEINIENTEKITFKYKERVDVILGSNHQIERKIATAKEILENKMRNDECGELDLTFLPKDNKTYFKQEHRTMLSILHSPSTFLFLS
ncbi:MAG: FtsQ-type POTRA domain-containing protein [Oscillospiraceae bacterium]|nr:FtsQ-type POTRA domain-containing protein [Oscillospiraceae bacterium]